MDNFHSILHNGLQVHMTKVIVIISFFYSHKIYNNEQVQYKSKGSMEIPVLFVSKLVRMLQITNVNKFAHAIALVRKFEVPTR